MTAYINTPPAIPNLTALREYQNPTVIDYFCHHHPEFNLEEGRQLFQDLLAWLWLNAYRQSIHKKTYLFGPLDSLDKLWHAFILHTSCYCNFCLTFFGAYFHHEIEPLRAEHIIGAEELADFLNDAIDHLGLSWVLRYFPINP